MVWAPPFNTSVSDNFWKPVTAVAKVDVRPFAIAPDIFRVLDPAPPATLPPVPRAPLMMAVSSPAPRVMALVAVEATVTVSLPSPKLPVEPALSATVTPAVLVEVNDVTAAAVLELRSSFWSPATVMEVAAAAVRFRLEALPDAVMVKVLTVVSLTAAPVPRLLTVSARVPESSTVISLAELARVRLLSASDFTKELAP